MYTNGKNNKSKNANELDGVIYTPSSSAMRDTAGYTAKKRPVKKTPQKSQYKTLMALTIASGFVICIIVFAIVYGMFSGGGNDKVSAPDNNSTDIDTDFSSILEEESGSEFVGVLQDISSSKKQITVLDVFGGRTHSFGIASGAELKNKFGQSVSLAEFEVGDIVSVIFSGTDITSLKENAESFEKKSVTNLNIDTINKTIKINNDVYSFTNDIIVRYKGKAFDISDISEIDVATIKSYKNTLWSVNVEKSHGYIEIVNADKVVSGTIAVDTSFSELKNNDRLLVSEGVHKVVIDGDNIEPFVKEVLINYNESYVLDLEMVQPKTSVVSFRVTQPDFELRINNALELSRDPLILDYGTYTMKVTKNEYEDWEEQIIIDTPALEIPVDLRKIVNMGKLTVNSVPSEADLYIDNAYIGITPITKDVVQGSHTIILKKEGYKDFTMGIEVSDDKTSYNINLQSKDDEVLDTSPDTARQPSLSNTTAAPSGYVPFETLPPYTTGVPFQTP